jgi:hypothetical protein
MLADDNDDKLVEFDEYLEVEIVDDDYRFIVIIVNVLDEVDEDEQILIDITDDIYHIEMVIDNVRSAIDELDDYEFPQIYVEK